MLDGVRTLARVYQENPDAKIEIQVVKKSLTMEQVMQEQIKRAPRLWPRRPPAGRRPGSRPAATAELAGLSLRSARVRASRSRLRISAWRASVRSCWTRCASCAPFFVSGVRWAAAHCCGRPCSEEEGLAVVVALLVACVEDHGVVARARERVGGVLLLARRSVVEAPAVDHVALRVLGLAVNREMSGVGPANWSALPLTSKLPPPLSSSPPHAATNRAAANAAASTKQSLNRRARFTATSSRDDCRWASLRTD